MNPTLTLEIPFSLLGLNDLKSSNYIPTNQQRTKPLEYIHATLLTLCPDIAVRLIASSAQITTDIAWHLYSSPLAEDTILTVDERATLSGRTWSCPVILQRSGIPIDIASTAWTLFTLEVKHIFSALAKLHAHEELKIVHGETLHFRPWNLVPPSQAQLQITLVPMYPAEGLDPHLLKRTLMLAAALEPELTLLTTPSALLKYWSVSRFLEFCAVRQLEREKAELRMKVRDKSDGTRGDAYAREKKKWIARFDKEDRASQRTKGRGRECWDVIDTADIHALISDIKAFKETGRRLGVEPAFAAAGGAEGKVTGLSFQQFHSTLDAGQIVAYTELIAGLAHLACDFDQVQISDWLVAFRQDSSTNPRHGFEKLTRSLHVSDTSASFFKTYLHTLHTYTSLPSPSPSPSPSFATSPFSPLNSHISSTLSSERAYIPTFIARYTAASGFRPTPTSKVYALMLADEQDRKRTRGNEDWLGGVREVGFNECEEGDIDENKDSKTRPVGGEEGVELGRMVREWLSQ